MNKIDFVIAWVDGNDPVWRAERNKYQKEYPNSDNREIRFRDWDSLRYFFRSVEKFAPWVNRIHFVTCGQVPEWLKTNHPKLNLVNHSDYIPNEFLPTFNANPIEINLHRIKGLEEQFVFFNDDMILIKDVKPEDFFVNGLPCDVGVMNAHISDRKVGNHIEVADMDIINEHFNKKEVLRKNKSKWFNLKYGKELIRNFALLPWHSFPGLLHQHICTSFLKSTFEEVWAIEKDILEETSSHKFRTSLDVNQWLFEDWQRCSGKFHPRNNSFGRSFALNEDRENNQMVFEAIRKQKYKVICFNDMILDDSFEGTKNQLNDALNSILPQKSSFEKE